MCPYVHRSTCPEAHVAICLLLAFLYMVFFIKPLNKRKLCWDFYIKDSICPYGYVPMDSLRGLLYKGIPLGLLYRRSRTAIWPYGHIHIWPRAHMPTCPPAHMHIGPYDGWTDGRMGVWSGRMGVWASRMGCLAGLPGWDGRMGCLAGLSGWPAALEFQIFQLAG